MRFEAVLGHRALPEDEAGVVHEHVEAVEAVTELGGERPDRPEAGEIERHDLDVGAAASLVDLLHGGLAPLLVASGDDHARTEPCELDGRLLADPRVPARDHNGLALHALPPARSSTTSDIMTEQTRRRRASRGHRLGNDNREEHPDG